MQLSEFRNEPLRDFKVNPEHARRMEEALEEVRQMLGREYDLVINGERIKTQDKFYSYNPGHKDQAVGAFSPSRRGTRGPCHPRRGRGLHNLEPHAG